MIKIHSAVFLKSFSDSRQIDLPLRPSFAFVGRSNVGKSSLINHLLNRKHLVKTSSKPGKTQRINFFLINKHFYFVDLPGYGFAHVPVSVKERWLETIGGFMRSYTALSLVIQLIDVRHPPSRDDISFAALLRECGLPCLIVGNKVDKVSRQQMRRQMTLITRSMNPDHPPLPHSWLKRSGSDEIWKVLESYLPPSTDPVMNGEPVKDWQ